MASPAFPKQAGRKGVCRPVQTFSGTRVCPTTHPPGRSRDGQRSAARGCRAGEWLPSAALWGVRPAKPHSFCHWDGGRHAQRTGHAGGGNVTATSPPATAARTLWETRTWPQRLPAREPRAPLLLLAEQAADGRLDALLLGGFVERVLAAVAAAGVAHGAVLRAC